MVGKHADTILFHLIISIPFLDRLKIEGSNVINKDIPASNGVVQVVENIIELGKSPI